MGRPRGVNVKLPEGVHAVKRKSGRYAYYWRPHRGTARAGASERLPDNPESVEFWAAVKRLKAPTAEIGGLARMVNDYLKSPHFASLKPNTQREYRRYMASLRELLASEQADDLKPHHIAQMRDGMGDTPAKANAYMRAIGALYDWGRERGLCSGNPALGLKKLKVGEYQPWPQWAWDLAQTHMREDLRTACALGLYTGQRLGDVLNMQLGDIRNNAITVRQAKTGKTLQITLHAELRPIIAAARARGAIFIVSRANGQPFSVDQFHAAWSREMEKEPQGKIRQAGFVFHGLRKSACVKMAEAGCTVNQIAAVTGQSLAMVEHYTKAAEQLGLARDAIERLEAGRKP
jgi:integrase